MNAMPSSTTTSTDFLSVTELSGSSVAQEQVDRLYHRYYWAGQYCQGKEVLEVACGTGQGLGYLSSLALNLHAGDYSEKIMQRVKTYYGERVVAQVFDAQNMPFADARFDVVIIFEALYYLPDVTRFFSECQRVLRPGGRLLIATANKDLYDFNPSPFSHRYLGVAEFHQELAAAFKVQCFGYLPITAVSARQKFLRPIKKLAVSLGLFPKTAAGKLWLKRLVFGGLVNMPYEIKADQMPYTPPAALANTPDREHKVLYIEAVKR